MCIGYRLINILYVLCFISICLFITIFFSGQDGKIDYGEFVAMMTKGNMGLGRRTMRNSLNVSMRDAPGAL
jgi:hypothetical protein